MKDKNSLTAIEYEEIYYVLNDYCITARDGGHSLYSKEVRQAKAEKIQKIMRKMEARMEEFPTGFYY
jgi:hypothetical protein